MHKVIIWKLLRLKDTNINASDTEGVTPLIYACRYGNLQVAQALINRGVDTDAVDIYGNPALHYALLHKHVEICDLLIDAGTFTSLYNFN